LNSHSYTHTYIYLHTHLHTHTKALIKASPPQPSLALSLFDSLLHSDCPDLAPDSITFNLGIIAAGQGISSYTYIHTHTFFFLDKSAALLLKRE
jgi:hypothetical protein